MLAKDIIDKMRTNKIVKDNMRIAFRHILKLYGFEVVLIHSEQGFCVDEIYKSKKWHYWVSWDNHNYRRIFRILKLLQLMELYKEADMFFAELENLHIKHPFLINEKTFLYWKNANKKL